MNRAAAESLGGTAALALLFYVLSSGAAYQERVKMAPADQLTRAQGVASFARTHVGAIYGDSIFNCLNDVRL